MSMQDKIIEELKSGFSIDSYDLVNESHMHNVPEGSESHFKLTIVSDDFVDKSLVLRHKLVYQKLGESVMGTIHALALHTYTISEWQKRNSKSPSSPPCMGGSKA